VRIDGWESGLRRQLDAQIEQQPAGNSSLRAIPTLLEREAELTAIARAIGGVSGGEGRGLIFTGAAGVGKTSLIEETRRRAGDEGLAVLNAAGAALEREYPFGVVRQLFEPALAQMEASDRAAALSGTARGAAAILGHGGEAPGATAGGDGGFDTLHALYWLTLGIAERGPLAVIVDDAHFGDPPSLRFLAFLARRLEGQPILLATASRDDPSPDAREAIDALAASPSVSLLQPAPLAPGAAAGFLERALEVTPDAEFATACHTATGGNPFLLGELAKTIAAERMEPVAANAPLVGRLGPTSVSRAVLARLAALGPATVSLARAVAVLGGRAELRDAAALAELEDAEASAAADWLVESGVLDRGRPIGFTHGIVRQAIYEDIGPAERAESHRRAARLLAERRAEPTTVASHLLSTEPAADAWAVERLTEAAEIAIEKGSPHIAIDFLRRTLDEPPPESERAALLARLGTIEAQAGDPDGIPRLREAYAQTPEPGARAAIARELAAALIFSGHATEAAALLVEVINEIEAPAEDADPAQLAPLESLLLVSGVSTSGGHRLAQARFSRLQELVADLPDRAGRLVAAPLALERVTCGGTAELGVRLAERALAGGRLLTEDGPDSPVAYVAMGAFLWSDRVAEAEEAASTAISQTQATGSARGFALASAARSLMRLRRGDLDGAEADSRASLELRGGGGGWEIFRMLAVATLAAVLIERSELDEAKELFRSVATVPYDPDAVLTQPLRESHARLALVRGEPDRALRELQACEQRERAWRMRSVVPIPWRSHSALARLALGDASAARRLAGEEVELARLFNAPRPIGVALRALGLVEGGEKGIEHLREAREVLSESSDRLEWARATIDLGAAMRRAGEKAGAREPLREGLEAARACGATALVERAYEELRATGARPRKILYSGVEALTPSERRVASMAAEGRTNREIAQALFVTPKTIEVHLSHAYQKLDITSRRELPGALGESATS
jgi:DNA-binding NarL/FixJ family response regulator